ncbi:hypothetical protein FRT60_21550 [Pseudomonas haemolytica]|uniref:Uncharacterized protein n=1 Tax=Pseudomonas haemolytica TaxID=2600065 RepID=A0A646P6T3_9PSED|nr:MULTISPECIES: hypothetical protein [Pseudomonas]MBJ2286948.1 hypothetical protein [Pseudomonas sp. MF6755]MRJ22890.1 hypothetical protein [Pseudomonas haemolytica]
MKTKPPSMSIIRGLLFTYDIENTDDLKREELIASINVNNEKELAELFNKLTRPEFLMYTHLEQNWFIDSIEHFLAAGDSFNSVFEKMATYFSTEIIDQRKFMQVLLRRLKHYNLKASASQKMEES